MTYSFLVWGSSSTKHSAGSARAARSWNNLIHEKFLFRIITDGRPSTPRWIATTTEHLYSLVLRWNKFLWRNSCQTRGNPLMPVGLPFITSCCCGQYKYNRNSQLATPVKTRKKMKKEFFTFSEIIVESASASTRGNSETVHSLLP